MLDPALQKALDDAGFTPGAKHLAPLLDGLAEADDDLAKKLIRTAALLGTKAAEVAMKRIPEAKHPARARLASVVGRVASETHDPAVLAILLALLTDDEPKTRRNAVLALGKTGGDGVEDALLDYWEKEPRIDHRRSVAEALGKIGGPRSIALLTALETDDAELDRIAGKARVMLARTAARAAPSALRYDGAIAGSTRVLLHSRAGLEELVALELGGNFAPKIVGPGLVSATLKGEIHKLFGSRTATDFGFPLEPATIENDDEAEAIVRALTSDAARRIFRAFGPGGTRFRLAFDGGGHRRALVFRVATLVAKKDASLANDPTESPWEARVQTKAGAVHVELVPKGLDDPRFTYRVADVPAASHPTIAAALAKVAGAQVDDVVWDPFVGSGLELIERARLGPYNRLIGTDIDDGALEAAGKNVAAAKIARITLEKADARTFAAKDVSLVISNPPMGRRVHRHDDLGELLGTVIDRAASRLRPGGRIVWLSPLAKLTAEIAEDHGLVATERKTVDMGGFEAELQRFDKPGGGRGRRG